MHNSVASRLLELDFVRQLTYWHGVVGDDKFATFVNGSVAVRLLEPAFRTELERWRGRLGQHFSAFVCESVADFDASLEVWYSRLGQRLGTFMCNSVAARLGDAEFERALKRWHNRLGEFFATFVCNGVAKRLLDPTVEAELLRWHGLLGSQGLASFCHRQPRCSPGQARLSTDLRPLVSAWALTLSLQCRALSQSTSTTRRSRVISMRCIIV